MTQYFECLHCGVVTPVEASPPKCAQCGHGTGVLHLKEPDKAGKKSDEERDGDKDRRR